MVNWHHYPRVIQVCRIMQGGTPAEGFIATVALLPAGTTVMFTLTEIFSQRIKMREIVALILHLVLLMQ